MDFKIIQGSFTTLALTILLLTSPSKLSHSVRNVIAYGEISSMQGRIYPVDTHILEIARRAGMSMDLDPALIKAIAYVESRYKVGAVSPKGAIGPMQLMPATAREMGVVNMYDAEENIIGGSKYFRKLLDMFDGDVELALAAYNAGPGNVRRYRGIPPYLETQRYVTKVLAVYRDFRES